MSGSEEETFGPCRPPESSSRPFIGPQVPVAFKELISHGSFTSQEGVKESVVEGMANESKERMTSKSEEDGSAIIGPVPSSCDNQQEIINIFERRAELMREKLLNQTKEKKLVRDDWMLKLPEVSTERKVPYTVEKKSFNQSSSTFDSRAEQMNRLMWSETPEERQRRKLMGCSAKKEVAGEEEKEEKEKNEAMKKLVEAHNRIANRNESLLESHKEKLRKRKNKDSSSSSSPTNAKKHKKGRKSKEKKEKKKEKKEKKEKKKEKKRKQEEADSTKQRRPFDRDVDLNSRGLMSAKDREGIIKNSMQLSSRFSHARKSHFL